MRHGTRFPRSKQTAMRPLVVYFQRIFSIWDFLGDIWGPVCLFVFLFSFGFDFIYEGENIPKP